MNHRPFPLEIEHATLSSRFLTLADDQVPELGHNPLGVLLFHAGTDQARALAEHLPRAVPCSFVDCAPMDGPAVAEVWQATGPVQHETYRDLHAAHDGHWLFGRVAVDAADVGLAERVRKAYAALLSGLQALGYAHPFRIWNYLPDINRNDAAGLERYRAFCKGRAQAFFEDAAFTHQLLPAGTCVGSHGGSVEIIALAAKHDSIVNIENPRQVPAYRYPPTYGPKPPSFARATYLRSESTSGHLFVSGTASVIGHASHHSGDVLAQCRATVENLRFLFGSENLARFDYGGSLAPRDLDFLKIYVRHKEHLPSVANFCHEHFATPQQIVLLADICRAELLVEIEGICRVELDGKSR